MIIKVITALLFLGALVLLYVNVRNTNKATPAYAKWVCLALVVIFGFLLYRSS